MLKIMQKILRFMAKAIINKYQPVIVGITGSVGKTSAKEAIFLVLSWKFKVWKNEKNYNNEIGIPLTIIGSETGGKSIFKWGGIFFRWLSFIILPRQYPKILVLEMGVDHPGDMEYLVGFIPLTVGIITNISGSHLEYFKSVDHIAREKGKIMNKLPEHGLAILNADDERIVALKDKIRAPILSYGFSEVAHIKVINQTFGSEGMELKGINFKISYEGKTIPVRLPHIIAEHLIYAALAAIAIGIYFKINLVEIAVILENYSSPSGRMNLVPGIKNSEIIDDTYNASPKSTLVALDALDKLSKKRKIAVLGDMLELGEESEKGHREVAEKVFRMKTDLFFAIGKRMEIVVKKLMELKYPADRIFYFDDPDLLGRKLQEEIQVGDAILVKGSQGMRMEKIVEEIMAEPLKAKDVLCRQNKEWLKITLNKENFG